MLASSSAVELAVEAKLRKSLHASGPCHRAIGPPPMAMPPISGSSHVEHAVIGTEADHRARHDHEVLVLAIAQHAHLHFLIRLHAAHLVDEHAAGVIAARDRLAVERDDEVAGRAGPLLRPGRPGSRCARARPPCRFRGRSARRAWRGAARRCGTRCRSRSRSSFIDSSATSLRRLVQLARAPCRARRGSSRPRRRAWRARAARAVASRLAATAALSGVCADAAALRASKQTQRSMSS